VAIMGNDRIYTARASDVIPITASLEIKKVTTSSYVITVTSNATKTQITVWAFKDKSTRLTFVTTNDSKGSAVIHVEQDLSSYIYRFQFTKK
jgi:hypothetical protein